MKQNAVGSAAGLEAIDDNARLRIYDSDRVVVEVAGVEQTAIGRSGNVADEVAMSSVSGANQFEGARRLQLPAFAKREFKNAGLGAAAHPDGAAIRRKS